MKLENNIGWCDVTMNPGIGCRGCELGDDCYAKFDTPARVLRAGKWPGYTGQPTETFGKDRVFVPTKDGLKKLPTLNNQCICGHCHATALFTEIGKPCAKCQCGTHRRIRAFCDSNSDWMDWPIDVLAAALEEIRTAPNVDVILLTKWPELFRERLKSAQDLLMEKEATIYPETQENDLWWFVENWLTGHPPKNIITLTSVLGNANDAKRIADINAMPSVCRGLSCEPLWAAPNFCTCWLSLNTGPNGECERCGLVRPLLDWIIVGCDSSKNHKGWEHYEANARKLIDFASGQAIPVYHKQMPVNGRVSLNPAEWPEWARVMEFYQTEASGA